MKQGEFFKVTTHANLGKGFEQALERAHSVYAVQKLAVMDKNPVEWRFTSRGQYEALKGARADLVAITNTGRFIKRVRSDVDFSGTAKTLDGRGISVQFDAKEVTRKSFPLANVEKHQVERLLLNEACGAIAGLMIHFSDLKRTFFVGATVVDQAFIAMLYKTEANLYRFWIVNKKGLRFRIPSSSSAIGIRF
jgi:penicillin-binding protein-related factor A (putative recombinase)